MGLRHMAAAGRLGSDLWCEEELWTPRSGEWGRVGRKHGGRRSKLVQAQVTREWDAGHPRCPVNGREANTKDRDLAVGGAGSQPLQDTLVARKVLGRHITLHHFHVTHGAHTANVSQAG